MAPKIVFKSIKVSIKSYCIRKGKVRLMSQEYLRLMQYMMNIQLKEGYTMKVHFNLLSQLYRGIMELFLLMDKLDVERHIPCLV